MDSFVWKPEEKREINVWIPVNLFNQIESAGYENPIQALIEGLKLLVYPQEDTEGYKKYIEGYLQDIEGYFQKIEGYKQEIVSLKDERDELYEYIKGYKQKIKKSEKEIEDYKYRINELRDDRKEKDKDIKVMYDEIEKLKGDLAKAPDPVTFTQLQVRSETLQMYIEEKEKRIETLERDKEDLKAVNNIYVQALINQKAIEFPKESSHAPKEEANCR